MFSGRCCMYANHFLISWPYRSPSIATKNSSSTRFISLQLQATRDLRTPYTFVCKLDCCCPGMLKFSTLRHGTMAIYKYISTCNHNYQLTCVMCICTIESNCPQQPRRQLLIGRARQIILRIEGFTTIEMDVILWRRSRRYEAVAKSSGRTTDID